jgi:hypothetical protein
VYPGIPVGVFKSLIPTQHWYDDELRSKAGFIAHWIHAHGYFLLVSECELGRLLTYLRTLTKFGESVCWQFLLCASMLTKYSHSAKKESGRDVCVCVCVCV